VFEVAEQLAPPIVRDELKPRSSAASITGRRSSAILAFMVQLARTPACVKASNSRHTPTRCPYSRHDQLGVGDVAGQHVGQNWARRVEGAGRLRQVPVFEVHRDDHQPFAIWPVHLRTRRKRCKRIVQACRLSALGRDPRPAV